MKKKNNGKTISSTQSEPISQSGGVIDEVALFARVAAIIENRKSRAASYANSEITLMYWEVGHYINSILLDGERAEYGKKIVATLSLQLVEAYGKNFSERNLYRMTLFAERFTNPEILPPLAAKLSWSHFIELLSLKSSEAILYYANDAAKRNYGTKELRRQISRKAFDRLEIANTAITEQSAVLFNVFKDPYLLDVLV